MNYWEGLNRRKFPRVIYPCLVTLRCDQGEKEVLLSHTENMGLGGICVILKRPLKMFAPVEIELDLLDFEEHINCAGKVVWVVRRKSTEKEKPLFYDIGIEFVGLAEKDHHHIEGIVQKFVAKNKLNL
jgi:Tfp pilus assembly protein PilZ